MMEKHKHPFAKYDGSINSKLIPKLSEQVIKEQEQEFKRIECLLTNLDISWLTHVLFNQTESNNGIDKTRQEEHPGGSQQNTPPCTETQMVGYDSKR